MLKIAFALFLVFTVNVILGSIGSTQFLGDVGELLIVISSVIFFVIAIIQSENNNQTATNSDD